MELLWLISWFWWSAIRDTTKKSGPMTFKDRYFTEKNTAKNRLSCYLELNSKDQTKLWWKYSVLEFWKQQKLLSFHSCSGAQLRSNTFFPSWIMDYCVMRLERKKKKKKGKKPVLKLYSFWKGREKQVKKREKLLKRKEEILNTFSSLHTSLRKRIFTHERMNWKEFLQVSGRFFNG